MKRSLLGLFVGLVLSLSLTSLAGENPFHIFSILLKSSLGSSYDLGLTLFYATSLVFTGLSVSVAFHAGLFNIGAEGQLLVAAITTTVFALSFPNWSSVFAPWAAGLFGVLAAALWGFVPGYLRARRESHEVVVTMMMNFVASGVCSYFVLEKFRSLESQNPETQSLAPGYLWQVWDPIAKIFKDSPANFSLLIAVALSGIVFVILYKTRLGFQIRMTGLNEKSALYSGLNPQRQKIFAMTLAGALAGFVTFNEILGSSGKFKIGFSPEYGFVGIAVALLANNNPLAILPAAFLFGALQKGASDLDLETEAITRDFAKILQAIILFSVVAFHFIDFNKWRSWWKRKT